MMSAMSPVALGPERSALTHRRTAARISIGEPGSSRGEPRDVRGASELHVEQFEQFDRVRDQQRQVEACGGLRAPQGQPAAALVPVDDREVLFEMQVSFEGRDLVDHGQARALLDQQQHRVRRVVAADSYPLGHTADGDGFEGVEHHGPCLVCVEGHRLLHF
jgi:hypothetical protein